MNSLFKLARLPTAAVIKRGGLQTSARLASSSSLQKNFDPENYSVPLRVATMDDMMEPYGSWKIAYEAERKKANFAVIRGIVCLVATCTLYYYSGALEGLYMPNLDNIMEDTEPCDFDKEGRVTV